MCELNIDEVVKENKNLIDRIDSLEKQLGTFEGLKEGHLESVEFNRALFEYSPIQTIVVDTEGRIIGYNQAKRYSGDSLPDIGDVMYRDYAGKHETDMYLELTDSIKTGRLKEFYGLKYKDKYLSIKISPFLGGAVITSQDITKQRDAENALRSSEREKAAILDSMSALVTYQDNEYRILWANRKAGEHFGLQPDKIAGMFCYKLWYNRKEPCENCPAVHSCKTGEPYEKEVVSADGRISITHGHPVRGERGSIVGVVKVMYDITERNQLEEQLQIRQRMDSIGTLAGGIAHDFNNILTGIMGYVDMLIMSSGNFASEQKEYLYSLSRSCERAADLTDKFHSLSRGTKSKKKSVDIYDVANEVFGLLKETTDRLIEKKIDIKRGEYYVNANMSELSQVFLNLGMNSVQAIESRGAKPGDYLCLKAEDYVSDGFEDKGLAEGEYVYIQFEDNGAGMSKEVQSKAFDPLFTTHSKGSKKGQGLGLAMVYNIVTRFHKGGIEIESKEGSRTIFHIYLPKAEPEKTQEEHKKKEFHKGGGTILVVDDEEIILNMLKSVYEKYKYEVLTALDGEEALQIYKNKIKTIDLVLLNLTMPKMSGRMVFERMLAINPDIKVMITSGHSREYSVRGILSKTKAYIKKPFKLDELLDTTKMVLDMEA